jgi:hypothetical protein
VISRVIWTHNRSLAGQQVISSPVSLLGSLLEGLFSHPRSQVQGGVSGGLSSQDGDEQQEEDVYLLLSQFNRLSEDYHVRGGDDSNMPIDHYPVRNLWSFPYKIGREKYVEDHLLHDQE